MDTNSQNSNSKTMPQPKFSWRVFLITAAFLLLIFGSYSYSQIEEPDMSLPEVSLSEIIQKSAVGEVIKLETYDQNLVVTYKDETQVRSRREAFSNVVDLGIDPGKVEIVVHDTTQGQLFFNLLAELIPFIIIFGVLIFFLRRMSGGAGILGGLTGGMKEEMPESGKRSKITFKDVAGIEEPKAELVEIVDFLKKPRKYQLMGAKIPKGVLLVGPPGTGKTLLARAIAGEANVPFFHISGSEFEEMFVGVGASRARQLFDKAKKAAPSIIFIDELDAIGKSRAVSSMGQTHTDQTLNQILVEMDGFGPRENVIVLAATNRPDVLDRALLRPGRFDRRVALDFPTLTERDEILKVHARGKKFAPNFNLRRIAEATAGFSGADLENLLNEAAIVAVKNKRQFILEGDVDSALEKLVLGLERKSRVLSKEEKEVTAYHEAGHALIAFELPMGSTVRKISIMSRGQALGATWIVPGEDKSLRHKEDFEAEMASLLGGRVAEETVFGRVTTGASNDLEHATQIARAMVVDYGMSSLGLVSYADHETNAYLRNMPGARPFSEETAAMIDKEVAKIIKEAYNVAVKIIKGKRSKLDEVAKELIKKEILLEGDIDRLFNGKRKKISIKK